MIYAERSETNIVVITRGGVATGADKNAQHDQPQVQPEEQKKVSFDVQRENEIFLDARLEFVDRNQASKSAPTLPR